MYNREEKLSELREIRKEIIEFNLITDHDNEVVKELVKKYDNLVREINSHLTDHIK